MTFYINHFMQIWLLPPGFNLLLLLLALLFFKKSKKISGILLSISFISLWLLSTPLIAQFLIGSLQKKYPVLSLNQLKQDKSAAIVILEAGINMSNPEYGAPIVSDETLTRLRYGAFLHQKTNAPILVSGNDPNHPSVDQTEYMADALKNYFHVPVRFRENKGYNTALEGVYTAQILRASGIKKIYLVTSAMHIPRSVYAFLNTGLEIIPAPTGYIYLNNDFGYINACFPAASALNVSAMALREYIGLIWYRLFYRDKISKL